MRDQHAAVGRGDQALERFLAALEDQVAGGRRRLAIRLLGPVAIVRKVLEHAVLDPGDRARGGPDLAASAKPAATATAAAQSAPRRTGPARIARIALQRDRFMEHLLADQRAATLLGEERAAFFGGTGAEREPQVLTDQVGDRGR